MADNTWGDPDSIQQLMALNATFDPIIETCEGFKAGLVRRGWDQETANICGSMLLITLVRVALATIDNPPKDA